MVNVQLHMGFFFYSYGLKEVPRGPEKIMKNATDIFFSVRVCKDKSFNIAGALIPDESEALQISSNKGNLLV